VVVRLRVLDRECPEEGEAWGATIDPLVPPWAPSGVMHVDLSFILVDNLSFEPLVNGVFYIYPISHFPVARFQVKEPQVPKVVVALVGSLPVSHSPVLLALHQVLLTILKRKAGLEQALHIIE